MKKRCEAKTKKDRVCKKDGVAFTKDGSKRWLCTMHLKTDPGCPEEPWTELGIMAPSHLNRKLVLAKIRRKLRNTTKDRGGAGSIYIYYLASETDMDYWKVGMTERTADERLSEWARHHRTRILKKSEYKLDHSIKFVERLVHLYLDYCRMHRTPTCDERETLFRSVWSATGALIDDEQTKQISSEERLVAKQKMVEWFHAPILDIKTVIDAVIAATAFLQSSV